MPESFSAISQEAAQELGLEPSDLYFLDLIPLIEMMWADGQVQDSEIEVLMGFVDDLMDKISGLNDGNTITKPDIIRFIERYTNTRPSPALLAELRHAAIQIANQREDGDSRVSLLTYCIDIAAACVAGYPYDENERICKDEKALLLKIISALDIPPDTAIPI